MVILFKLITYIFIKKKKNKKIKSEGIDERVASAEQNSTKLLQDIRKVLEQVQGNLGDSLKNANQEMSAILNSKNQIDERQNEIFK